MHRQLSVLLNLSTGGAEEMLCSRAFRELPRLAWTIDLLWLFYFGEPNHTYRINWTEERRE